MQKVLFLWLPVSSPGIAESLLQFSRGTTVQACAKKIGEEAGAALAAARYYLNPRTYDHSHQLMCFLASKALYAHTNMPPERAWLGPECLTIPEN